VNLLPSKLPVLKLGDKAHCGKPFSPEAFILPAERQKLIKAVKKDEDNKVQSWWIGKPENGGSGRGCLVYPSGH